MTKIIKWVLFALVLGTFFGGQAKASTLTAASCNVSDVLSAINSAKDGDTVIIPNGSCSWSSGISTAKQITLQGASVGGVTITDTDTNAADSLLSFTIGNSFHTTIANLRFLPGTGKGSYVSMNGTGLAPLMHDVYFNLPNFQLQHAVSWAVAGGDLRPPQPARHLSARCAAGGRSAGLIVRVRWFGRRAAAPR